MLVGLAMATLHAPLTSAGQAPHKSPTPYSYRVLHSFAGGLHDGSSPIAPVIRDAHGNLYGTATEGGTKGWGVAYKLTTSGNETILHNFYPSSTDGGEPSAGVIQDAAGNLYSTTLYGGSCGYVGGCGIVFKIDTTGKETLLHSLIGYPNDGETTWAGLVRDANGNLYGTSPYGGAFGDGVVFKLAPDGKETLLYQFTGGVDGSGPWGGLIRDNAGNLYGMTSGGGANLCAGSGCGVVYKLTAQGKEIVLHSFTGADGQGPFGGVIRDAAGNLYGLTEYGGAFGNGVVFRLGTAGKETVLHSFAGGTDGVNPLGNLVLDGAGNLYGTTLNGGNSKACNPRGCGTVFKVDKAGTKTVLHSFSATDGASPWAGLIRDAAGNLYGTTSSGGASSLGVVFKLSPPAPQE